MYIFEYATPLGGLCWILRDKELPFFRTNAPLHSEFAWVKMRGAAARFATRDCALKVAKAYDKGYNTVRSRCRPDTPSPENVVYPRRFPKSKYLAPPSYRKELDDE